MHHICSELNIFSTFVDQVKRLVAFSYGWLKPSIVTLTVKVHSRNL